MDYNICDFEEWSSDGRARFHYFVSENDEIKSAIEKVINYIQVLGRPVYMEFSSLQVLLIVVVCIELIL